MCCGNKTKKTNKQKNPQKRAGQDVFSKSPGTGSDGIGHCRRGLSRKALDSWFAPQLFGRIPEQPFPSPPATAKAEKMAMEGCQVLEGNTTPARLAAPHRLHSWRLHSPPKQGTDASTWQHYKPSSFGENPFCRTGQLKEASETCPGQGEFY